MTDVRFLNCQDSNSGHALGIWICGCSLFYKREPGPQNQWVHIVLKVSKSVGAKGDVPKICGFIPWPPSYNTPTYVSTCLLILSPTFFLDSRLLQKVDYASLFLKMEGKECNFSDSATFANQNMLTCELSTTRFHEKLNLKFQKFWPFKQTRFVMIGSKQILKIRNSFFVNTCGEHLTGFDFRWL